jgi:uncharacterized protein DUF6544
MSPTLAQPAPRSAAAPIPQPATLPGLPAPVRRFRELALRDAPASFETVVFVTSGTMRRPALPPIPLRIRMAHRLGRDFVHDIRIGIRRASFRFGLDAFIGGRGVMRIGPVVDSGPDFDEGALIAMWGEAMVFPCSWGRLAGLRWEAVDDATAILIVPHAGSEIRITIGFGATGLPATFQADRHKGHGPKVGWTGTYGDWRRYPSGVLAPGTFTVKWDDEARPWLEIRIERVDVDISVDEEMALGRAVVRRARR